MKKKLFLILSLLPALKPMQAAFSNTGFSLNSLKNKLVAPFKKGMRSLIKSNKTLDVEGYTPTIIACKNGDQESLKNVLSYRENQKNLEKENGWEACAVIIRNGHFNCFNFLLNYDGTGLDWKNEANTNLIVIAVKLKKNRFVKVLCKHSRISNKMKKDALIALAQDNNQNGLKMLLKDNLISKKIQKRALRNLIKSKKVKALKVLLKNNLIHTTIQEELLEELMQVGKENALKMALDNELFINLPQQFPDKLTENALNIDELSIAIPPVYASSVTISPKSDLTDQNNDNRQLVGTPLKSKAIEQNSLEEKLSQKDYLNFNSKNLKSIQDTLIKAVDREDIVATTMLINYIQSNYASAYESIIKDIILLFGQKKNENALKTLLNNNLISRYIRKEVTLQAAREEKTKALNTLLKNDLIDQDIQVEVVLIVAGNKNKKALRQLFISNLIYEDSYNAKTVQQSVFLKSIQEKNITAVKMLINCHVIDPDVQERVIVALAEDQNKKALVDFLAENSLIDINIWKEAMLTSKKGVDVGAKLVVDEHGNTKLMLASKKGNLNDVKLLIEASGADPNAENYSHSNSLILTAEGGHEECLDYLLKSFRVKEATKQKAYEWAYENRQRTDNKAIQNLYNLYQQAQGNKVAV